MERESKNCNPICIIGYGASGSICAYYLLKAGLDVIIFDKNEPLKTLLPTGGGRCNLAHSEYDLKELAKNYPRGEKFLYSVFSNFSTYDTLALFEEIGIKTYTQEDGRIFPVSNSAKDVRNKFLSKTKKVNFQKENVLKIISENNGYKIITNKATYWFKTVIISIGGHSGCDILENIDVSVIPQKSALVGLKIKNSCSDLSGIAVHDCVCEGLTGDILFTHYGISGPLIYKISSLKAFDKIPYELEINLCSKNLDLQKALNKNPHKSIKNVLSNYLPQRLVIKILKDLDIMPETESHFIDGNIRDKIIYATTHYRIKITGADKGEETVMAGGIDLNEIIPQTMQFKKYPNLYATGEILNIDGFCGGFNLQNAWSTAYVAAQSIMQNN